MIIDCLGSCLLVYCLASCILVLIELRTHKRASPLRAHSFIAHHQLYLLSKTTNQLWPWSAIYFIISSLELEAHALPVG